MVNANVIASVRTNTSSNKDVPMRRTLTLVRAMITQLHDWFLKKGGENWRLDVNSVLVYQRRINNILLDVRRSNHDLEGTSNCFFSLVNTIELGASISETQLIEPFIIETGSSLVAGSQAHDFSTHLTPVETSDQYWRSEAQLLWTPLRARRTSKKDYTAVVVVFSRLAVFSVMTNLIEKYYSRQSKTSISARLSYSRGRWQLSSQLRTTIVYSFHISLIGFGSPFV